MCAVNLLQAARFWERHAVSGAKSDDGDRHVLADVVRTHSHQLRPGASDSAQAGGIKVLRHPQDADGLAHARPAPIRGDSRGPGRAPRQRLGPGPAVKGRVG